MIDVKLAARTFTKTPFITTLAVLSLALGIGANTAIYSLFDQMLLRALPVQQPDRLVNLRVPGPQPGSQSCNQAGGCDATFSYPMFRDLEKAKGPFSGVAAHRLFGANLAFDGHTLSAQGLLVSGSYFPVLGVKPALGRVFGVSDDVNIGESQVVVLSYNYWENRLGKDPSVLNRSLVVNGQPMTVVGVAAKGFTGTTLGAKPDVFVPLTMRGKMEPWFAGQFDNRRSYWAYVFARLKPGMTVERAAQQINTTYSGIISEVEAPLQTGMSPATMERFKAKKILLEPGAQGQSNIHHEAKTPLTFLFSITGLVLLIACANIANLLLARGAGRNQEMAIRSSLGAGRGVLLAQLLTESVLLALVGGAASLLVAKATLRLIGSMIPAEALGALSFTLSPSMVVFSGALALGTAFLFGLFPALHASRTDLVSVLKSSSGQPSGAKAAARFRTGLVTAQISLSMVLLVASGLFIKSLLNVSHVDLGIDTDHTAVFGISPVLNGYKPAESMALFQRAETELGAIPGVTSVTTALVPVLGGSSWGNSVAVQGFQGGPDVDQGSRYNEVGPHYFSTLKMPLVAGREFDDGDVEGAPKVAIINEAFAKKFGLDPHNAVGKFMSENRGASPDQLDIRIVGVVQNAKYNDVKDPVPPLFFRPYRQDPSLGFITFYVRSSLDTDALLKAIPPVMKKLDPNLPLRNLMTLNEQVKENVFADRLISTLSAAFAALATLLAAVGLYGVLAYTVSQRTREIGLRMALGAGAGKVRGMVLRQVARMLAIGGVVGIGAGLLVGRAAQSLLYQLKGSDPWVVTIVSLLLALIALAAGYVPALRASRVEPMQALRYE